MANAKNKNKSISLKKICMFLSAIFILIFLVLYINKWKEVKEQEKYLNSYLINTYTISLEMNAIKDIHSVLSETPNYYFLYISYNNDKSVYNFEKKLKPLIDEYNLQNNFYYLNVTDIKAKNKDYKNDIANELNIDKNNINEVPVILYFKDGKLANKGITTIKEFKELLKAKNIKSM